MNNILKLIRERRSVRTAFDPRRPVAEEDLRKVLEAGRWAPTPHNMQNFEVLVIDDDEVIGELGTIGSRVTEAFLRENYELLSFSKEELMARKKGILGTMFPRSWRDPSNFEKVAREISPMLLSEAIDGSPLLIIVIFDPTTRAPDSEGDLLGIIGLGCVMENMWLMATALGISVRILSDFGDKGVEEEVKRVLAIPGRMRVAYGLRLGYPLATPREGLRVRRDIGDLAHHNGYGKRFQ